MSREFLTPVLLPADPVNPLEAATKQYVDAHSGGGGGTGGGNSLVGFTQTAVDATFGTGNENLRVAAGFVARTGQQYVIKGLAHPRQDVAASYTAARLRWDTVATGATTGTVIVTGIKDHRAANRAEMVYIESPPFTYSGTDGATLYGKLTLQANTSNTGTDNAGTYGPTWVAVEAVGAPGSSAAGSPFATGFIQMFAGTVAPVGWLLCDGSPIPGGNTALIGMVGANTPDLRGRFPYGAGTGAALLANEGAAEATRTPVHTHTIANVSHAGNTTSAGGSNQSRVATLNGNETGTHNHGGATGSSGTGIPYFSMNFIIKT